MHTHTNYARVKRGQGEKGVDGDGWRLGQHPRSEVHLKAVELALKSKPTQTGVNEAKEKGWSVYSLERPLSSLSYV